MFQKGTILENRYLLAGQMASGGFADIYVASDMRLGNKPVIIKMLRSDFTDDLKRIRMFIDEINLTTCLDHENIVRVYDVLRTGEDSYLQVLELIDGPDLKQIIAEARARKEEIPLDLVSYILNKVCLALHYAHELADPNTGDLLSIVHRDISPSNILISYDGKVKLTDFGIAFAHLHQRQKTQTGEIKGKLSYMSPEQVMGQKLNRQSDIYSLGIVMFETLTRKRLFEADSDFATLTMVAEGKVDFKPLDESNVPEAFKEVLHRALQKNVTDRYGTTYEMYRDIQKTLGTTDEVSLREKLKEYLAGMRKETRLTQLLRTLKGEAPSVTISEVSLTQEKIEKKREEEKTIYDLIRQKQGRSRKVGTWIGLSVLIAAVAFLGLDTFLLKSTPLGEKIYNSFFPPNLVVESIPSGAEVFLDGSNLNKITPFNLSEIPPGTHQFQFQVAGYKPVFLSSQILSGDEWKKTNPKDPQRVLGIFSIPLSIQSNPPGAKIYLDDAPEHYSQSTPATIPYPLREDSLRIRLELEGFESLQRGLDLLESSEKGDPNWKITKEKDVEGYYQFNISGTFYAPLTVNSVPEGAFVIRTFGEEADTHKTPATLYLGVGRNLLKVEKEGMIPWEKEMVIESGKPDTLQVILKQGVLITLFDSDGKTEKRGVPVAIYKQGRQVTEGNTPLKLSLETGRFEARFKTPPGYQSVAPIPFETPALKPVTAILIRENPLLTVRVMDAKTLKPIENAEVFLGVGEEEAKPIGRTSNEGIFQKRNPPGEISVEVSVPEYKKVGERYERIQWPQDLEVVFRLEPLLKVPDLSKKTREEAEILLRNLGLSMEVVELDNPSLEYGIILEQNPSSGEIVEEGATIKATVNVKKEVPIPQDTLKKEEVKEDTVKGKEAKEDTVKAKEVKRRRSGE